MQLNEHIKSITAFAPATCGNVAVGFDILGFASEATGDEVTLIRNNKDKLEIAEITANDLLPLDINKNIATAVIQQFCFDHQLPCNFTIKIKKGIAIGSGMGGSAASAVAALVALNGFLETPADKLTLAKYAVIGEGLVSGSQHGDNVVPCLYGGITLIRNLEPLDIIQLPRLNLFTVLIHPNLTVNTKDARNILPEKLPLTSYVQQSAQLASFIVALYESRIELIHACLQDTLVEPWRAKLVTGFSQVKQAALSAGALGASLSGSGPSIFAFAKTQREANHIKENMMAAFAQEGVSSQGWISPISPKGAHICQIL